MTYYNDGDNYDCEIEFDGASKGSPGLSGAGAILRDLSNHTTWHLREGLGRTTCNAAEYKGLILGLRTALQKGYRRVHASGDSELVCNQVAGNWCTRSSKLKILNREVRYLRDHFDSFWINHVGRENNREADREANKACLLLCGTVKEVKAEDSVVMFREEEAMRLQHPHNDALVVTLAIAHMDINRIMISCSSPCNILFKQLLDQCEAFSDNQSLVQIPICGLYGEPIRSRGMVTLPLTVGEAPRSVTKMADFEIVDAPSSYNAVIGGPTLNAFRAVASTYHLMLKFPTPEGVGIVEGDQDVSRRCYDATLKRSAPTMHSWTQD